MMGGNDFPPIITHRQGDFGRKFSSPTKATGGGPHVFINGCPAMREGDEYEDGNILKAGSSSIFINGKPVGCISISKTSNGGKALEQFPKSVKRFSDKNCGKNKRLEQERDSEIAHSESHR